LAKKHRADIDGLRAVAIAAVLAYHFGLRVPGGYGGVDVFFVISGFLITGIIKSELEAGTFSLAQFYVRRIRRILPALTVCLVVTTAFATAVLFPLDFKDYARSLLSALVSISNFYFMQRTGYFDSEATSRPLLHTWSLGVEEQFYAAFPLLLIFLFSSHRKAVAAALAVLASTSLAWSAWRVEAAPDAAFYSTIGRVWELMIGALLAFGILPQLTSRLSRELTAALGAAMIAYGYMFYTDATPFPGIAALPFCLGAALIIHAGTTPGQTTIGRILSFPPMVALGLISYSVYLWHWPLLVLSGYRFPELFARDVTQAMDARLALAALSLVLGALSWWLIEQPFRRMPMPRKTVFTSAAISTLVLVLLSVVMREKAAAFQGWPADIATIQFRKTLAGSSFGLKQAHGWPSHTYKLGATAETSDTLLWGDSFAEALIPGFMQYSQQTGQELILAGYPGCPPLPDLAFHKRENGSVCTRHNAAVLKKALGPTIKRVVIAACWSCLASSVGRDSSGRPAIVSDGSETEDGQVFASTFETLVKRLAEHNKNVVIIGPVPRQKFDVATGIARHIAWSAPLPPELTFGEFLQQKSLVLPVFARLAKLPNVRVLYPNAVLCHGGSCAYSDDGKPLYSDRGHLNARGAMDLHGMIADIFTDHPLTAASDLDFRTSPKPQLPEPVPEARR
jgi:peptidoglycan/LPS O-acetylase OafA/YrhL